MNTQSHSNAVRLQNPRLQKDHRVHRRVEIGLHGRFLNDQSEEHSLLTINISCGGALVKSPSRPAVDSQVVVYLDELGRVAGTVVRHTEDGYALHFHTTQTKRDKLADKLIWLSNCERLGLVEERGAQRFAAEGPALIVRQDGRQLQCRVVDISLTGAGFIAEGPPPMIGEIVETGTVSAEVVRSVGQNFGVRFIRPLSE
ncbi:MAG: PilZ domain-containing protein [Hyphomonadaceae bacterium]